MKSSSTDEVQIIGKNHSIVGFLSCLIVEEHPPSPEKKKRKIPTFVSTLPRKKTRSARTTGAVVGWQNMEHAIAILLPLSSLVEEAIVTQEPTPSNKLTVTQEPTSSQNLVVTQEPLS